MIFVTLMLSAFLYGAVKGYRQWKAQQLVSTQQPNRWRN